MARAIRKVAAIDCTGSPRFSAGGGLRLKRHAEFVPLALCGEEPPPMSTAQTLPEIVYPESDGKRERRKASSSR